MILAFTICREKQKEKSMGNRTIGIRGTTSQTNGEVAVKRALKWSMLAVVAVFALVASSCATTARSTQEVFEQHHAKVGAETKDVPAIAADYADDAVIVVPDGAMVGKAAIEAGIGGLMEAFPNLRLTETSFSVEGDTMLVMWKGTCDTGTFLQAIESYIIRNDRIQRETVWFDFVPNE